MGMEYTSKRSCARWPSPHEHCLTTNISEKSAKIGRLMFCLHLLLRPKRSKTQNFHEISPIFSDVSILETTILLVKLLTREGPFTEILGGSRAITTWARVGSVIIPLGPLKLHGVSSNLHADVTEILLPWVLAHYNLGLNSAILHNDEGVFGNLVLKTLIPNFQYINLTQPRHYLSATWLFRLIDSHCPFFVRVLFPWLISTLPTFFLFPSLIWSLLLLILSKMNASK